MNTATLDAKGRITLPPEVRAALGLRAGDKIEILPARDGSFVLQPRRGDVRALRGLFAGRVPTAMSVEDMDQAIAAEAAARL
jgi:AbrB family looped-hinge helix DNA binding protein